MRPPARAPGRAPRPDRGPAGFRPPRRWPVPGATGGLLAESGAVAVLCAALLVLSFVPLALLRPDDGAPPPDFGALPGAAADRDAATSPGPAPGAVVPGPGPDAAGEDPPAAPDPVRLRMPGLGVDAAVDPVGVAADGGVEIPEDAARTGWYRFGPAPGSAAGSAVIVGHVDDRTGDLGVLAALYEVRPGDEVSVERSGAPPVRYEVTARRVVPKEELPEEVFRRDGSPVLTLITCAGPYDRDNGGYRSNMVVTAVAAGPEAADRDG
ncbi:hypothetical protein GCM10009716_36390 [Streptomyces sodiiphilus]|uniref:Class F sortase n=1 Tax=Streptomyces sodiiphilus TaxID=226217 RepID=A0ABN2PPG1_9ACTN